MTRIARSLTELYDPETGGNAFLIDGLTDPETLETWVKKGVLGQTSNQTLFLEKVKEGVFDEQIAAFVAEGKSPAEIFNILYNQEALRSASVLERLLDPQRAFLFSRETDATRADDPEYVVREAVELQSLSPWLMIKLANVGPSPEAIRAMIRDAVVQGARSGHLVNPNITLVFGMHHYLNTVAGYIEGLELARADGADISRVKSVNSLFVSRLDTAIDGLIDERIAGGASDVALLRLLKGKAAVANAKLVYRLFRTVFLGEELADPRGVYGSLRDLAVELSKRFQSLGPDAPLQRLLIASSSNKKPGVYSELIYVLPLLGPYVANTVPLRTLEALERKLQSEGIPVRATIFDPLPWIEQTGETIAEWERLVMEGGGPDAKTPDEIIEMVNVHVLQPLGRTLEDVTDELRDKGAQAFARDQMEAYRIFEEKVAELKQRSS